MADTTTPAEQTELGELLEGLVPTIDALDLAADDAAERLEAAHPMAGETMQRVRTLCEAGVDAGWLVPREAGPKVRFGRFAKDMGGYAVDCVLMEGAALGHTHPRGEVNIGLAWEGEPLFDGQSLTGWETIPAEPITAPLTRISAPVSAQTISAGFRTTSAFLARPFTRPSITPLRSLKSPSQTNANIVFSIGRLPPCSASEGTNVSATSKTRHGEFPALRFVLSTPNKDGKRL